MPGAAPNWSPRAAVGQVSTTATPAIVSFNGVLCVFAASSTGEVTCTRFVNDGWQSPVVIGPASIGAASGVTAAVSAGTYGVGNAAVYVSWAAANGNIMLTSSLDGLNWSPAIAINGVDTASDTPSLSSSYVVGPSVNYVTLVWRNGKRMFWSQIQA
jgi:hypothetical protein